MYDNDKDLILGQKVGEFLKKLGIESPIFTHMDPEKITMGSCALIEGLGLSLLDESISKTPERITKFYMNELFYGLNYANFPKITFNHNSYNYSEPVIAKNISFKSTCEHHFVTINGSAYVGYIPKQRVIGLSKINRIVDFFARRPQVQERATLQIFHALSYILDTEDIALFIKAEHHCITMRGVNDQDVENITYKFGGQFLERDLKEEFISYARG